MKGEDIDDMFQKLPANVAYHPAYVRKIDVFRSGRLFAVHYRTIGDRWTHEHNTAY